MSEFTVLNKRYSKPSCYYSATEVQPYTIRENYDGALTRTVMAASFAEAIRLRVKDDNLYSDELVLAVTNTVTGETRYFRLVSLETEETTKGGQ